MARKKKHEEHENHERWLVSYADFITLLFAFFTSLYAMSTVSQSKFKAASESLSSAFSPAIFTSTMKSEGPLIAREQRPHILGEVKGMFMNNYQKVQAALKELTKDKKLSLVFENEKITIRVADAVLFVPGSDEMMPEGMPVLDELAAALKDVPNDISIDGHTDNIPTNTPRFPTNWDLSSARSLKILKYLIDAHKYDPKRLSASGYGEFRPLTSNDTPDGRAKNRRVELQIFNPGSAGIVR
ncbi:MAG: OmpA family protein [Deltaproteobacteria bacterium]|nr:OmpA family protein [Deltaproteobacteria bacterium]